MQHLTRRDLLWSAAIAGAGIALPERLWAAASDDSVRQLRAALSGQLIMPGDSDYEALRLVFNRAYDRRPRLIARCSSAEDVQRCVEFARNYDLPLAVRSGGHSQAGFSTCDGGILIDLALENYREFARTAPDELSTFGGVSTGGGFSFLEPGPPRLFLGLLYSGDPKAADEVLAPLRSKVRPVSEEIRAMNYFEAAGMTMPPTAHRSTSIFLPELSDAVIDLIVEAFGDAPPRSSASWSAYDGAVARIPIEASAFPLRGTGFGTGISLFWVAPEEREHAVTWVDRLGGALRPHGRGAYVNTLGNEGESRVREAYGSNYERLAQLKKKYDPTNLFQLNQNVTPAA